MNRRIAAPSGKRSTIFAILLVLAAILLVGVSSRQAQAGPAQATDRPLGDTAIPQEVSSGAAQRLGLHKADDELQLLFMLPFRDSAGLAAFNKALGTKGSPQYQRPLTLAEANARFNPDPAHEKNVMAWLQANGVKRIETQPNHLFVVAYVPASLAGKLLNTTISDYQNKQDQRVFFAPERVPVAPAQVSADVTWVAGLDNAHPMQTTLVDMRGKEKQPGSKGAQPNGTGGSPGPPYCQHEWLTAYGADTSYDGSGETIAITMWTVAPSDFMLVTQGALCADSVATRANGRLRVIYSDGSPSTDTNDGEAALDIETASGVAPGANIIYYEAQQPNSPDLAIALNLAGTNPDVRLISNSWGGGAESQGELNTLEPIFQSNSATGHVYLFNSGDRGSYQGGSDPRPSYPPSSQYVLSVGGTRMSATINSTWPGESAWQYCSGCSANGLPVGSGGGYSLLTDRPAWQVAPGFNNTKRGYPDVAAAADQATGAFFCSDSKGCGGIGGTSLSTPIWAGLLARINHYLHASSKPYFSFPGPTLYAIYASPFGPLAFHDITSGTNGAYNAGSNWDAVTGLGSPNVVFLEVALANYTPATPTRLPTSTATAAPCVATTPINAGFESNFNNFTSTSAQCDPGGCGWVRYGVYAHSGQISVQAPELTGVSDQSLVSPSFAVPANATTAELSFWHYVDLETGYDGGVLEFSTDGISYTTTTPVFIVGGYNGGISDQYSDPLANRAAWTGHIGASNAFLQVRVNLMQFAGQNNVSFRFRQGNDTSTGGGGWWIDDVTVTIGTPCPTATRTATTTPTTTRTPTNTPTITTTSTPCATTQPLTTGFESATLLGFSSAVATCVPGGCGWTATTSDKHGGTRSAFAPDQGGVSDQSLVLSNAIGIPADATSAVLSFWQRADLETNFDGGVLEFSTDGGTNWSSSDPDFISGGYNGGIDPNYNNPLGGRAAWTGLIGGAGNFQQVRVNLMGYKGQSIKFRLREGSDEGTGGGGWWVDDFSITIGAPCGPGNYTATRTATRSATPTRTATRTPTSTRTASPTLTASFTVTSSTTATRTITKTRTPTLTRTATRTPTSTTALTRTVTRTTTVTRTRTTKLTLTATVTRTPTRSATRTATLTRTRTITRTATVTRTPTRSATRTVTLTRTRTITRTATVTRSATITPTRTATATRTATSTRTRTATRTPALAADNKPDK